MRVWLYRGVSVADYFSSNYVRAVDLPITPFVGLCVMLSKQRDGCNVEHVSVNAYGAVIVSLEDADYDTEDLIDNADDSNEDKRNSIESQIDFETKGWTECKNWDHYKLRPPTDEELRPIDQDDPDME